MVPIAVRALFSRLLLDAIVWALCYRLIDIYTDYTLDLPVLKQLIFTAPERYPISPQEARLSAAYAQVIRAEELLNSPYLYDYFWGLPERILIFLYMTEVNKTVWEIAAQFRDPEVFVSRLNI